MEWADSCKRHYFIDAELGKFLVPFALYSRRIAIQNDLFRGFPFSEAWHRDLFSHLFDGCLMGLFGELGEKLNLKFHNTPRFALSHY
jgi:hypothetical protein